MDEEHQGCGGAHVDACCCVKLEQGWNKLNDHTNDRGCRLAKTIGATTLLSYAVPD